MLCQGVAAVGLMGGEGGVGLEDPGRAGRHAARIIMSSHLRMTFGTSAGRVGIAEAQLASVACS